MKKLVVGFFLGIFGAFGIVFIDKTYGKEKPLSDAEMAVSAADTLKQRLNIIDPYAGNFEAMVTTDVTKNATTLKVCFGLKVGEKQHVPDRYQIDGVMCKDALLEENIKPTNADRKWLLQTATNRVWLALDPYFKAIGENELGHGF